MKYALSFLGICQALFLFSPTVSAELVPMGIKQKNENSDYDLSFGGSLRERFESYRRENFNPQKKDASSYFLHRALLHADFTYKDAFRTYLELGSALSNGKNNSDVPYRDSADFQQLFVDISLPDFIGYGNTVRVGRQEMVFGSQHLISIRDAPSVRRSFDGVRLGGNTDDWRYDMLYVAPVAIKKGSWDDAINKKESLWGGYFTRNDIFKGFNIDLFYLGLHKENAAFSSLQGKENRHSIGYRLFGQVERVDFELENLYQFGQFAGKDISAWGLTTDSGYNFSVADIPVRLGAKLTASSGDRNKNDNKISTYNGLYPKMAYFNQAGLLGTQNMTDLQPNIKVSPVDNLNITLAHDILWRQTTADAVYTSTGRPITNTIGKGNKYTSSQTSVDVSYDVTKNINVNLGYVYVKVSKSLAEAGGRNTSFSYIGAAYKF